MCDVNLTVEKLRRLRELQVAGVRRYDLALGHSPIDEETGSNAGGQHVQDFRERLSARERLFLGACCTLWIGCIVIGTALAPPPIIHADSHGGSHAHALAARFRPPPPPPPLLRNDTLALSSLSSGSRLLAVELNHRWANGTAPSVQQAVRSVVVASDDIPLWLAWFVAHFPAGGKLLSDLMPHGARSLAAAADTDAVAIAAAAEQQEEEQQEWQ